MRPLTTSIALIHGPLREHSKKSLRVMKFGGTSVADASASGKSLTSFGPLCAKAMLSLSFLQ